MGQLIPVQWTTTARFDLRRLRAWTERYSGSAGARQQAQRIQRAVESLRDNPRLGTPVHLSDEDGEVRQLVLVPYVMRYLVEPERLVILRLWHGREGGRGGA